MNEERTETIRKLGKAAERFRMLAASPMKRTLRPGGIIVQAPEEVNLFLLAEGIGLAGGDGLLLMAELDRTRQALADLLTLASNCNDAPFKNAVALLEGVHEHDGLRRFFTVAPD